MSYSSLNVSLSAEHPKWLIIKQIPLQCVSFPSDRCWTGSPVLCIDYWLICFFAWDSNVTASSAALSPSSLPFGSYYRKLLQQQPSLQILSGFHWKQQMYLQHFNEVSKGELTQDTSITRSLQIYCVLTLSSGEYLSMSFTLRGPTVFN